MLVVFERRRAISRKLALFDEDEERRKLEPVAVSQQKTSLAELDQYRFDVVDVLLLRKCRQCDVVER